MRKKMFAMLLLLSFTCFLISCSNDEVNKSESDTIREPMEEPMEEIIEELFFDSVDDVLSSPNLLESPFFILRDGRFFLLNDYKVPYRYVLEYYYVNNNALYPADKRVYAGNLKPEELPVLNLQNGDELVCFNYERGIHAEDAEWAGFSLPIEWLNGITLPFAQLHSESNVVDVRKGIDEIDGIEVEYRKYVPSYYNIEFERVRNGFFKAMDSLGLDYIAVEYENRGPGRAPIIETTYIIVEDQEQSITLGQYDGTLFNEDTFSIDTPTYYTWVDSRKSIPYERTKNGYFTCDLSSLSNNVYVIGDGLIEGFSYLLKIE